MQSTSLSDCLSNSKIHILEIGKTVDARLQPQVTAAWVKG